MGSVVHKLPRNHGTRALTHSDQSRNRLAPSWSVFAAALIVIMTSVLFAAPASSDGSDRATTTTATPAAGPGEKLVTLERSADGSLSSSTIELDGDLQGLSTLSDRDIVAIEAEVTFTLFADDPHRASQWALDRTTFEAASSAIGSSTAVVAVLDTGIRGTHEDLAGVLLPGADFVDGSGSGLVPDHFHGSHVAGIVAAASDNGIGITGAGPTLSVLPVRVLNGSGSGSSSDVANGIIWAADNGADVINLSLGATSNSLVVEAAIDYAVSQGVVVVAAAGNSGNVGNPTMYPAALPSVVSVAAVGSDDNRAEFSAYGTWIDITAPGVGVLSLHNGGDSNYAYANGTSMAAPYVAAAAGLLTAADPSLTVTEIRNLLHATAEDLGSPGKDNDHGYGLVDPAAAIAAIGTSPDGGVEPPPSAGYSFVTNFGRVISQGIASDSGSLVETTLAQPIVSATSTPTGNGYWLTAGDGGIFTFGDAVFHGSTGALALAQPIVGMAGTPSGNGYWLVASDGGIFTFGDAQYLGSTGAMALAQPIVGMASTPTGNGYWLVGEDGGIFTFGDAAFHGSTGAMTLRQEIVSVTATPSGTGYWLTAADGGIFTFGDAAFHGSTGAMTLNEPIVSMSMTPTIGGYWLTAADGGVFSFGDARYAGSVAGEMQPGEYVVALIDPEFA